MSKSPPPPPPLLERQGLENMTQSGNHNETHKGQILYYESQNSVKDEAGVSCYCQQIPWKEQKQPCIGASIRLLLPSCSVALSRKPAGYCWRWKSEEMGHEDMYFDLKRQLCTAGFSSVAWQSSTSSTVNKSLLIQINNFHCGLHWQMGKPQKKLLFQNGWWGSS